MGWPTIGGIGYYYNETLSVYETSAIGEQMQPESEIRTITAIADLTC
jgi:hypothetical protein